MAGYVKLFGSILQSTVWLGPLPTKIVWITMLALADRDGVVEGSIPGLAHTAGVARGECEEALNKFLSPDPDSRTSTNEGRRIVKVPGGWRLLNFEAYRERLDADDQREKAAERKRRQRDRQATTQGSLNVNVAERVGDVTSGRDGHAVSREVTPVTPCHAKSRQAEAEAEAEASPDQKEKKRPIAPLPASLPRPSPTLRDAIARFDTRYRGQNKGAKPTWGAKQSSMLKRLIASHGAGEVMRRIDLLFDGKGPAFLAPPFDAGTLVAHFDKLAVESRANGRAQQESERATTRPIKVTFPGSKVTVGGPR